MSQLMKESDGGHLLGHRLEVPGEGHHAGVEALIGVVGLAASLLVWTEVFADAP